MDEKGGLGKMGLVELRLRQFLENTDYQVEVSSLGDDWY
jgi:hypothetical protein